MKKLLLASVFAIASFPGYAHAANECGLGVDPDCLCSEKEDCFRCDSETECKVAREGYERMQREAEECHTPEDNCVKGSDGYYHRPPARVTVAPPYQGPPPIGWVYAPYTMCGNPPQCSIGVVNVQADGLNVRVTPNGPAVMALVNGTPLYPVGREGDWLLVAPACDLTPTWAWSWTAGVPLNRCWVYF